jgi:hypothetical protein
MCSETEELNFKSYLIIINLNLNRCIPVGTTWEFPFQKQKKLSFIVS